MLKVSLMPALRRRAASITLAAVVVLLAPAAAFGQSSDDRLLWATVNVCDTPAHPDTVGIRGAMPGSGVAEEQMFMRFELEFYIEKDKRWQAIGKAGDSGFVPVGSARFKQRQSGRNFTVRPPEGGASTLRGALTFEWRVDAKVVRRERRRTSAKRGRTAGSDPAGFSAATCEVMS